MTQPQPRHPGTTYAINMVCERGEFRLRPDRNTSGAFAVALADAADRYGIQVVAVTALSSHYHAVVHDPSGSLSAFLTDFHSLVARYGNTRDKVKGVGFWNRQQAFTQALGDVETVIRAVAYCIANPVTSFLVENVDDWVGVRTRIEDLGQLDGPVWHRPPEFFRKDGPVSDAVELVSELPPMVLRRYKPETFQAKVRAEVERLCQQAHADAKAKGHGFVGMKKVLAQSVWNAPKTTNKRKAGSDVDPIPRVAAATKPRLRAMIAALKVFRDLHYEASQLIMRGIRSRFPPGTWRAWRYFGVVRSTARPFYAEPLQI